MKPVKIIFALTVLGGVGLLILAVWPGLLEFVVFGIPFILVTLPLLASWFLLLAAVAIRDLVRVMRSSSRFPAWGILSSAVMFGTMALLWLHVPKRIAFLLHRDSFQALVDAAPATAFDVPEANLRIGAYSIDRYFADDRGGVYFRTLIGPDGMGPDQMSYGFAYRPNHEGTPFGNAHYRRRRLFREWYVFAASDDW